MAGTKDYCNDFIETEQGQVPVKTALDLLRYYYQEDILLGLYDFAEEHHDMYIYGQIRAFRKRRILSRKGGSVASQGNLSRISTINKKADTDDVLQLNYFAPSKILKEMLREEWFKELRHDNRFNEQWTDSFVEALMSSEWKDCIARDWAVKGKRNKRTQIKGFLIGILTDAGVLNGSYDSIAMKIGITDEPRSFSRYMGQGKRQPYADWLMEYVKT